MYRRILVSLALFSESKGFIFPGLQTESTRRQHSKLSNSYWGEQEFDFDGFSERLRLAYEDWCQTYGENFGSSSRMEVFSYHFMVAENYSRRTGVKVKLNQFAGLTQPEIEHAMGRETNDNNIERPLGAEFLDYELEEESSRPVLTSAETIDPPRSGNDDDPPRGYNWFGSNAQDRVAIATNALLEQMDKDSIVPSTDINLFKEINESILEKESISLDGIVKEEPPSEEVPDPVNEEQNEGTDLFDESTLIFLSYLDRLSREKGLETDSTMDEDTGNRSKPKSRSNGEENTSMITPIQDVLEPEIVSDPSNTDMDARIGDFNPEEAYFFAGQGSAAPTNQQEVQPEPPATPMAREAAKRANIDLSLIEGTGKDGRITLHDVEVARDGMVQSPEDVWQSYTPEERIQNGPFRQPSHGFYADPTPSTFNDGGDSIDPPTDYGVDEYTSDDFQSEPSREYQEQGPDLSQEMLHPHEEAEVFREDPTTQYDMHDEAEVFQEDPTTQYDMYDETFSPDQQYQADIHFDENQYPPPSEDEFRQELGDPSNQFDPRRSNSFNGSSESPESTIGDEDFHPPLDSLDERIERAIQEDLEFASQRPAQHSEEPQRRSPQTSASMEQGLTGFHFTDGGDKHETSSVHRDTVSELKDQDDLFNLFDQTQIGPTNPHDLYHDGPNDEVGAVLSEAKKARSDEKSRLRQWGSKRSSVFCGVEVIPTNLVGEGSEDENFDPPDWVVGNAGPLAPPHLSGAEKVTEKYEMESVDSTEGDDTVEAGESPALVDNEMESVDSTEGDDTVPTAGESPVLVDNEIESVDSTEGIDTVSTAGESPALVDNEMESVDSTEGIDTASTADELPALVDNEMESVDSTEGDDTASTAGESPALVDNDEPQERDEETALVDKPQTKRARRVSSTRKRVPSPVFLDSVTSEVVEGDQVQLPELTFWMSEAKIQKWCKKVGDPVHVGETLMVVACDTKISVETLEWSATQEVKATSNGFLVAKHFGAGEMISKGWTIGVIGTSTDGLTTVDPEPIITYIEEGSGSEEDEISKKPKNVSRSNPPQKKKKAKETAMPAKGGQSKVKKKKVSVKKSQPSRQTDEEQVATSKEIQKRRENQEAPKRSGWKSSPSVAWEPHRVKMDGLNHILIPFLQTKIEAWERRSKFQLPATSSLEQEVLSSKKNKMTIRWEPQRNGKEEKKKSGGEPSSKRLQSQHCFASLPAVSWQFEKSQLPSESSNPTKKENKRTRQIFFLEPNAGASSKRHARQRLGGGKTQWDSFPKLIKWENVTHPLSPRQSRKQKPKTTIDGTGTLTHGLLLAVPPKMVYATPMARAAARMANLDLKHVSGSGVRGRITLDDVKDVLYPMLLEKQQQDDRRQTRQQLLNDGGGEERKKKQTQSIRIRSSLLRRIPYASPMAKKLAEEHEIDLGTVKGSGPRGRILLEDVQK